MTRYLIDAAPVEHVALATLATDLISSTDGCWRFFETILGGDLTIRTTNALAQRFGLLPITLTSRFVRAGLPSPKVYLAAARAVRLVIRMELNPRASFAAICYEMHESTPQSASRWLLQVTGKRPTALRATETGQSMLDWFRREFVLRYRPELRHFDPLHALLRLPTRRAA